MDVGESSLPATVNSRLFPAKLWRLVNNPANKAIFWDRLGKGIIVDQVLFEKEILSQGAANSRKGDGFKTSSFTSFVRQLNLYGFKRAKPDEDDHSCSGDSSAYHHFFNPNFKRNRPELVERMVRLTVKNKAKLQDEAVRPRHHVSSHHGHLTKSQSMTTRWNIGPSVVPEVASSYTPMHIQQGLSAHAHHGSPNFTGFNYCAGQYQPFYHSPDSHYYHSNLVASSGLQTGLLSPQSYYQAGYPVKTWCIGENNQDLQIKNSQEVEKVDVNLDSAFQIADDMLPVSPNNCPQRAVTPEKQNVLELSSKASSTVYHSAKKANPLCVTPSIVAVAGKSDGVTCIQELKSVIAVPEQLPEDAIV